MSEPLHMRLSRTMREGKNHNGPIPQADWIWVVNRLTPEQVGRIESMASEHECSTMAVLRDWPELFDPEGEA